MGGDCRLQWIQNLITIPVGRGHVHGRVLDGAWMFWLVKVVPSYLYTFLDP